MSLKSSYGMAGRNGAITGGSGRNNRRARTSGVPVVTRVWRKTCGSSSAVADRDDRRIGEAKEKGWGIRKC